MTSSNKQAACLNCRKSKIRCKREPGAPTCEKCENAGTECVIPSFHVGRQKGVKNKRTGLDKAIFQIEEAIRKSKSDAFSDESTLEQLQHLLDEARGANNDHRDTSLAGGGATVSKQDTVCGSNDEQLALDDAENPLQLLARASDLRLMSPQLADANVSTPSAHFSIELDDPSDVHRFFLPMRANYDVGSDLDPIDIGLLTVEEAAALLDYFHGKLAHTRWGLDPDVHTLEFVRSRSAFLLTSLLTAASRFLPATGALSKRLLLHRKWLWTQIIARRYRSVEIVLAFLVNVPWMQPGGYAGDDDTGNFIALALSVALDLSLNKIIKPSASFEDEMLRAVPKADCIDAKKALVMDGFDDVDVRSAWGQRLLRRRERVWIALFVLERGVCLARGRSYSVPVTPLVNLCDKWHTTETAIAQDGALICMAVLRRDLDGLFNAVRNRCDNHRAIDAGSTIAEEIEATIEGFYNYWLSTWTNAIGEGEQNTLPPYVEIMLTHTRLSTYSGVMNHPTAPPEVKRLFRASALSSALNVMRAAIQGETRLKSMPNNTVTMICFAACIALNLSGSARGESDSFAPSVRKLVEETAAVLERIGGTPSHRMGMSVLYGKYLRELIKQTPAVHRHKQPLPPNLSTQTPQIDPALLPSTAGQLPTMGQTWYAFSDTGAQPLQFSAMSGNEVIETVNNVGDFDPSFFDVPMNDVNAFGWMDWLNLPEFGF